MRFFLKDEQYYAIINTSTGVWYNGSIGVSKTFDGSSILSAPAKKIPIFPYKIKEESFFYVKINIAFFKYDLE